MYMYMDILFESEESIKSLHAVNELINKMPNLWDKMQHIQVTIKIFWWRCTGHFEEFSPVRMWLGT